MPDSAGPWRMSAHRYRDGLLHNVGSRSFVDHHGLDAPVLEVEVSETNEDDPRATHWGWLRTDGTAPIMIYPRRGLFEMCFPYGPALEERSGKGRTVRLTVEEIDRREASDA